MYESSIKNRCKYFSHFLKVELCQPFKVRVIENFTSSPYENLHLNLQKNMIVTVFGMKTNGKWFGQFGNSINSKMGWFPFNRVEQLNSD